MKRLCRNSAIIATSIFGLIGPAPYSHAQATRSDSLQTRVITFEDRVAYQYAIEEVYWRHRIWPKENPNPKPALDAVMTQQQIEKKVEDSDHIAQVPLHISCAGNFPKNFASAVRAWEQFLYSLN